MSNDINHMKARCGHVEPFGYFTNTPCKACVRKAHRNATQESSKRTTKK